ncbi:MAG: threonine synthase [Candidatus Dormibacteria bacterium]
MNHLFQLECPECRRVIGNQPKVLCDDCFTPLEVAYDLERLRRVLDRELIESRPRNLWRYRELLPVVGEPSGELPVGFTPLLRAPRLGERLGARLWLKNDAACLPTLSFKDRVVAVALAQAQHFGFRVVACASTGNLANAVAAQAARLGLEAWVFLPAELERAKLVATEVYGAKLVRVDGDYDQVNRLCAEIAETQPWGFVNVNLRPFYAEGSKTVAFEIAEQLGWRLPDNVVVPMAGGAQLSRIARAFSELVEVGLVKRKPVRVFGAQAQGCSPIATACTTGAREIVPQKADTICRSLAIGTPADGFRALQAIRASGGWAEAASDPEIVAAMGELARTEGIFGETAAGVTVAVTSKLVAAGRIGPEDETVLCISGNGLKTTDPLLEVQPLQPPLPPRLAEFEALLAQAES